MQYREFHNTIVDGNTGRNKYILGKLQDSRNNHNLNIIRIIILL